MRIFLLIIILLFNCETRIIGQSYCTEEEEKKTLLTIAPLYNPFEVSNRYKLNLMKIS